MTCPNCGVPVEYQRSGLLAFFVRNLLVFAGAFWIASLLVDIVSGLGGKSDPITAHAREALESYTIIKDECIGAEERSVTVLLERRISEEQLKQLARRIRSMKGPPPDRTFISYYVSWQSDSSTA